jgi:hypothetical protein
MYREILQVQKFFSLQQPLPYNVSETPMNPRRRFISKENSFYHNFVIVEVGKGRKFPCISSRDLLSRHAIVFTRSRGSSFTWIEEELNSETDGRIVTDSQFRIYRGKKTTCTNNVANPHLSVEGNIGEKKKRNSDVKKKERCPAWLIFRWIVSIFDGFFKQFDVL